MTEKTEKTTPKQKPKQPTNKPTQPKLDLESAKLNNAARELLEQIPDHAGQLVHELAKQTQIPLWQHVCGVLLAVHQEGRLSEFRLDPAWKDGLRTKELVCKHCGKKFNPRHVNQPYCSNACGMAANPIGPFKEPKQDVVTTASTLGVPVDDGSDSWSDSPDLSMAA